MILTLSLISIFSPFISILTVFFRVKYLTAAKACFSFWLYKRGTTYGHEVGRKWNHADIQCRGYSW